MCLLRYIIDMFFFKITGLPSRMSCERLGLFASHSAASVYTISAKVMS